MNLALLGFGTVGSCLFELLKDRKDLMLSAVLSRHALPEVNCRVTPDYDSILSDPSVDTVVELIGGLHPAHEYLCAAIRAGKNVVTANKLVMIEYYDELTALAEQYGVRLRCTGAAGGGIPWFPALTSMARRDELTALDGILNNTTDYILTSMERSGTDYALALKKAQAMGRAEKDPTSDVEGLDALRKLALSINVAFDVSVILSEIPCFGISSISKEDLNFFRTQNKVCRLFAHAEKQNGTLHAWVCPTLFAPDAPQPNTRLTLYARRIGRQSFSCLGNGSKPSGISTAGSVLADCLDISDGCSIFYNALRRTPVHIDNHGVTARFYCRADGTQAITEPMALRSFLECFSTLKQNDPTAFFAMLCESEN